MRSETNPAKNNTRPEPELARLQAVRLGQLVRARRLELELSQGQLAGLLGLSKPYISRFERGDFTAPSYQVMRALAQGLGWRSPEHMLAELKTSSSSPRADRSRGPTALDAMVVRHWLANAQAELSPEMVQVCERWAQSTRAQRSALTELLIHTSRAFLSFPAAEEPGDDDEAIDPDHHRPGPRSTISVLGSRSESAAPGVL